jgi:phosphatidylserine/phosphatidylglycerophosphate/cardiolipin synthase-like enzyme
VELLIQPDDGVAPLLEAIRAARQSVDMTIFRFDQAPIERALRAAAERGVQVRTLVAHTNSGGEKQLRALEDRLLDAGVVVCRTARDLVRYHGKPMIIDRSKLLLFGFNYTHLDIEKSRSFGIATRNRGLVREAVKLFEADVARQPYRASHSNFIVSPHNSRQRLTAFIRKARRQLLIYDPQISDGAILEVLQERARAGVDIRILGRVDKDITGLVSQRYPGRRLHVRAMIRDGKRAFIGSQSLRRLELEERREIGILFRDRRAVRQMLDVFEYDWARAKLGHRSRHRERAAS